MKKRTTALLLAAALALSLLGATTLAAEGDGTVPDTSAVGKEQQSVEGEPNGQTTETAPPGEPIETYIPDPVGSISFHNLEPRMHEYNLQIMALQESIDMLEEIDYDDLKEDLRLQLNQIAQMQWMMVQMGQTGTLAYEQMDQAYDAVRKQFDAIKDGDMQTDNADTIRQLKNLQNQIIMAGEATYIALAAMEIQESGLERQLSALDRTLKELELRCQLGHISTMTLRETQAGRAALASGLSTLRMNLNTYKGQLELLIGADITGTLSLGALPNVTRKELDSMDLEKDLATAKANSWDLYEAAEALKDEKENYDDQGGEYGYTYKSKDLEYMKARHSWYAAQYNYENTVQNFELSFRNLYLKVRDYRQILDSSQTALAVEQDKYSVAQLKYSQGNLSQNALMDAEDRVKEAQEKVASGENDLFSAYNTYRWAVDHGILN